MKKKIFCLLLGGILAAGLLTACGGKDASGGSNAGKSTNVNNVEDVLQDKIDAAEGGTTQPETVKVYTPEQELETGDIYGTEGVDIDLTQLSGPMLYSQVNYMMYKPEKFVGQTVMVPGDFSAVYNEEEGRYYFGCLVRDRAACCVLGVEFVLPENYVYPDDYPAENERITVKGVFDTYQQGPYTYCVLRDATMVS